MTQRRFGSRSGLSSSRKRQRRATASSRGLEATLPLGPDGDGAGEEWIAALESVSQQAHRLTLVARAEKARSTRRLAEISRLSAELRATKRDWRAATAANTEFLVRMGHELRTPLTAVLGLGELLEGSDLDDGQRQRAAGIVGAGRHLLRLLDDVADIVRVGSGQLSMSIEAVPIEPLVRDIAGLMEPSAAAGDVRIEAPAPGAALRYVLADNHRLRQVLINLLSNAIKYNRRPGAATISVEDLAEGLVNIAVADTGMGLTDEEMARLFVAYERLDARRARIDGRGLGLALSKQLIDAMGGTLTVTSRIGIGSVFTIQLRRDLSAAA